MEAWQVALHGDKAFRQGMVLHAPFETRLTVMSFVSRCDVSPSRLLLDFISAEIAAHQHIHCTVCGSRAAELPRRLAGPLLPRLHLHGVVQHPDHGPSGRVGY